MKRTPIIITGVVICLGVGGYFAFRPAPTPTENSDDPSTKSRVSTATSTSDASINYEPQIPATPRKQLSNPEAEQLVSHLSELIKAWRNSRDENSEELKNAWHNDRKRMVNELGEMLAGSASLRKEFFAMLASETDPFVQNLLVGATNHLPAADKQDLAEQLVQSPTASTRKIGVELLPKVGTEQAFTQLKEQIASDSSPEVQKTGVTNLAKFDLIELRGGGSSRSTVAAQQINDSLRSIADNYDASPELREAAFRGLISRVRISQDDKNFVAKIAADSRDPKLQDLAKKAMQAYARQRHK